MSLDHYILVDRQAVPFEVCGPDGELDTQRLMEWAENMQANRIVAQVEVGTVYVSTIWLGLDHSFFHGGPPKLFETMVFVGGEGVDQWRYSTWAEAETAHMEIVEQVQAMNAVTEQTVRDLIARIRQQEQ